MATLLQNPCFVNTLHSNWASSSSFCVNFRTRFSVPQNFGHNSQFLPLNSSQKFRVCKAVRFGETENPQAHGTLHLRSGTEVTAKANAVLVHRKFLARASAGEENTTTEGRSFLSIEEAGLVEMSGLSTHERFLCRLTISSLNLLRVIAEQEGCEIKELNAGRICDWFLKDKLKREQDIGSAVLQWDDDSDDFQF